MLTSLVETSHEANQQVYGDEQPREGKFSHELVAGAASFEAMKLFEDRQRKEGKTAISFSDSSNIKLM
jgi:hypothetical protein